MTISPVGGTASAAALTSAGGNSTQNLGTLNASGQASSSDTQTFETAVATVALTMTALDTLDLAQPDETDTDMEKTLNV